MAAFACAMFTVLLFTTTTIFAENAREMDTNATEAITSKPLTLQHPEAKTMPTPKVKEEAAESKFPPPLQKVPSQEKPRETGEMEELDDFWNKRNALAEFELHQLLGNHIVLDERELRANDIIRAKKFAEYDKILDPNQTFPPSISFVQAKPLIQQSEIYQIIRKLPKGANLYGMLLASVDLDFMYQLTLEDNLYFRFDDHLKLKYSLTRPGPGWRLLSQLRETTTNNPEYVDDLNQAVRQSLTLTIPNKQPKNEISVWDELLKTLQVHSALATYKPNFIKIFRRTLEILHEDNVMYAELRYEFPELYDLNETVSILGVLTLCQNLLDDFKATHQDFVGVRFIYAPIHEVNSTRISYFVDQTIALWKSNQELIAGLGFIRREENQEPLSKWADDLLRLPKDLKLFLGAGLTNNWGTPEDYNLLDAIGLDSVRIGEGFALNKHPVVLEQLREKGVAVEFSPILSQVLNYVEDIRSHPHAILVATDFPVVIGNPNGGIWGNTGLSYEWYEVYMALTPKFCDLRCLKQLALNSWVYSTLSTEAKRAQILTWKPTWDKFIEYVIKTYT